MMQATSPEVMFVRLREQLLEDLEGYGEGRLKDVRRGAETPALAALLLEKYGYGLSQALRRAAEVMAVPHVDLTPEVDRWTHEIDPHFDAHRQQRWSARPAGLHVPSGVGTVGSETSERNEQGGPKV
jgi:hypothetical protein